jgi:hypothetical protein
MSFEAPQTHCKRITNALVAGASALREAHRAGAAALREAHCAGAGVHCESALQGHCTVWRIASVPRQHQQGGVAFVTHPD